MKFLCRPQGWDDYGSPDPPCGEEGRALVIFCNINTCGSVPFRGSLPVLPVRTGDEGEDGMKGFILSPALSRGLLHVSGCDRGCDYFQFQLVTIWMSSDVGELSWS